MLERAGRLGDRHEELQARGLPGPPVRRGRRAHRAARRAQSRSRARRGDRGHQRRVRAGMPTWSSRPPSPPTTSSASPTSSCAGPDGRYLVQDTELARGRRHRAAAARGLRRAARPHRADVGRHRGAAARRRVGRRTASTTCSRLPAAPCPARAARGRAPADDGPVAWGDRVTSSTGAAHVRPRGAGAPRRAARRRPADHPARPLFEAGIDTIDALAASEGPVPGSPTPDRGLRVQAACSSRPRPPRPSPLRSGAPLARRAAAARRPSSRATPRRSPRSTSPTRATCSSTSRATRSITKAPTDWGIEYLCGVVVSGERFSRCGPTTLPRSARRSWSSSPRRRAPSEAPRHAHLPLRGLRDLGAQAPRGTGWARRSSTTCCAEGVSSISTRP